MSAFLAFRAGAVDFVAPTLDENTRTMRARLVFQNPDGRLKPGMVGTVMVALPPAEGLVVPREAIVDTGAEQYLFVALDGGRFEPRRVKLGARAADKAQILEGVAEGETVVTTANFLIDSESRLRSAIEGQGAQGGP
jgi:Cu(I)/Ag(I) efflux system membrane fusion protein